jgi:hypothetical protein
MELSYDRLVTDHPETHMISFQECGSQQTSSGKWSSAGAPAFLARSPRRFELSKPPEPREMRGGFRVTMQRKPRHSLYFRFDRLE